MKVVKENNEDARARPEENRFEIKFEGAIIHVALGDTGADESAIDKRSYEKIQAKVGKMYTIEFPRPCKLQVAINTGKDIKFSASKRPIYRLLFYSLDLTYR